MSLQITAARPYAQAAFASALASKKLADWSGVIQTLAEAVRVPQIAEILSSPQINDAQRFSVLAGVAGNLDEQQQNFVRVLLENQRAQVLPEISEIFEALKAEEEKTLAVTVDSAFELSAEQKQKIAAKLQARMGREIRLSCQVNPDLLGGVVIRAGDKVIDGSARTRLGELSAALA